MRQQPKENRMENLVLTCLESRIENNRNLYGRFLLGPFINGHAITIATALRRALLSEIKGVAITALEIQGTTHEFSTIEGVRESVLDIVLNFQKIVLYSEIDLTTPEVGYLQIQGPGIVRAIDLKLPLGIQCVDPTQYIATLSTGGLLVVKFLIVRGNKSSVYKKDNSLIKAQHIQKAKAFYTKRSKKEFKSEICFRNIIPLDFMFNPIHRVNFLVESDDLSNKPRERLILEVWTNGSIHPRQAIHEAALYLIDLFSVFRKMSHLDSHFSSVEGSKREPLIEGKQQKLSSSKSSVRFPNKKSLHQTSLTNLSNQSTKVSSKQSLQTLQSKGDFSNQSTHVLRSAPSYKMRLMKRLASLYKTNFDKSSFLSLDLCNLSLSLKTYTLLKQNDIHTIDDILKYSLKELFELVNKDKQMFSDVRNCFLRLGLQIKK